MLYIFYLLCMLVAVVIPIGFLFLVVKNQLIAIITAIFVIPLILTILEDLI